MRQVTTFSDYDVFYPSLGPSDIVFQAGGRLYLLDLKTEKVSEVPVQVVTDRITLKPKTEKVANLIRAAAISPTGKRAVFEARGDVFTVPAEYGPVMNLTRSSGFAERFPEWSPDGKTLAFWSDRSGEYELTLRSADGSGMEQKSRRSARAFATRRTGRPTASASPSSTSPRASASSRWPAGR